MSDIAWRTGMWLALLATLVMVTLSLAGVIISDHLTAGVCFGIAVGLVAIAHHCWCRARETQR